MNLMILDGLDYFGFKDCSIEPSVERPIADARRAMGSNAQDDLGALNAVIMAYGRIVAALRWNRAMEVDDDSGVEMIRFAEADVFRE